MRQRKMSKKCDELPPELENIMTPNLRPVDRKFSGIIDLEYLNHLNQIAQNNKVKNEKLKAPMEVSNEKQDMIDFSFQQDMNSLPMKKPHRQSFDLTNQYKTINNYYFNQQNSFNLNGLYNLNLLNDFGNFQTLNPFQTEFEKPKCTNHNCMGNHNQNSLFDLNPLNKQNDPKQPFQILRNQSRGQKINKNKGTNNEQFNKNICRYIARQIVRNFVHPQFEKFVLRLCKNNQILYKQTTEYYLKNIETISGHRALRNSVLALEEDDDQMIEMKKIFRQFCYWFLKNRSIRFILCGNMVDKTSYIRYKNQIMLHYISKPERWNRNCKVK